MTVNNVLIKFQICLYWNQTKKITTSFLIPFVILLCIWRSKYIIWTSEANRFFWTRFFYARSPLKTMKINELLKLLNGFCVAYRKNHTLFLFVFCLQNYENILPSVASIAFQWKYENITYRYSVTKRWKMCSYQVPFPAFL